MIQHDIVNNTVRTDADYKSEFVLTKDTPYTTFTGELWGVYIVRSWDKMIVALQYRSKHSSTGTVGTLMARFMGPTWGPSGTDRTQVGPMLAPWTLLSGESSTKTDTHILSTHSTSFENAVLKTSVHLRLICHDFISMIGYWDDSSRTVPYYCYRQTNSSWQYMMPSSYGNIFHVTGYLCGEFTGPRWIPAQRPVTQSFDVFLWYASE